jgi:hypothetical protein
MVARRWRWTLLLVGVIAVAGALAAAVAPGPTAHANRRDRPSAAGMQPVDRRGGGTPAPASTSPAAHARASTTTSTTTTTTVPATQTTALPSATTPQFHREMAALFQGIRLDAPSVAAQAFFPERAYVALKALPDPAADFEDRLMAELRLDVAAAHVELGAQAAGARLVTVTVPEQEAAWIPPGFCVNSIGYWHDPGARLLYTEGGVLRSIGIASLISWHGVWYVVHLGGVVRSSTVGLVDTPAVGPGVPGPAGGC